MKVALESGIDSECRIIETIQRFCRADVCPANSAPSNSRWASGQEWRNDQCSAAESDDHLLASKVFFVFLRKCY